MNLYQIYVAENDSASIGAVFIDDADDPIFQPTCMGHKLQNVDIEIINYNKKGIFYDWLPGWSWAPFVAAHVYKRIGPMLEKEIQWVGPFAVEGHDLFLFNCINVIDCAKNGSNTNKLFIDDEAINNQVIFRPKGFEKSLIVTEGLKKEIERSGDTGIRFGKILDDGWIDHPFS